MTEDDAQRLREKITHDQTACRCGHLLAACADCRGWLIEHSPRIAFEFEFWYIRAVENDNGDVDGTWGADAAEADDRAYYLAGR